ncbi:thiol peroxidase [Limibacter armeniacum]|uniref:thiol peroxidase n=1 Tax=Limibacter armeniacum TaxID=466084 RepID=UPI002FE5EFDE
MARITFKGNEIHTAGTLPEVGSIAPNFKLTKTDLSETSLQDYEGKKVVLNIFPSIDTGICAASTRSFNEKISGVDNAVVICVSKDLPFAHKRFCEAEGLDRVVPTSQFKDHAFEKDYGLTITDGPLAGLLSRAVVVIDENGKVVYTEQVPEIAQEPNYDAALDAVK